MMLLHRFIGWSVVAFFVATITTTTTTTNNIVQAFVIPKAIIQRHHHHHHHYNNQLYAVSKCGGKMIETVDQFTETVLSQNSSKPVLVFFTAPWCGPCRLSIPVVKGIRKQYSRQLEVVEVCTDELADVAESCGVVSIPTIQFYYNGQLLDTIVGCVAKSVLANAVDKVLEDDMVKKSTTFSATAMSSNITKQTNS